MMKQIESEAKLSFGEATSIIVGHGVGSGILAIPYLASRNSLADLAWILAAVYFLNLLLHLMIAELSLNNGGAQFIRCFESELFTGKLKTVFTWLAFALLGFSVLVNVSGFIVGSGVVLVSWFGLPKPLAEILFYLAAAVVVYLGMKAVGVCERIAVISMGAVIGILVVGTFLAGVQPVSARFLSHANELALFSMVSFALSAVMSVPQVVKGLGGDVKKIRASIAAGTGINLLLVAVITFTTLLGVGGAVSQNGALVDLSARLGGWVGVVGYVFTLLALATSFWANTLNLRDVVNEQTKWGAKASWAAASIPSLAVALLGGASFVGFTRLAGVVQVLTGLGVILAYHHSRKQAGASPVCGKLGSLPFQILVIVSSLLATVGSLISIS